MYKAEIMKNVSTLFLAAALYDFRLENLVIRANDHSGSVKAVQGAYSCNMSSMSRGVFLCNGLLPQITRPRKSVVVGMVV